MLTPLIAPSVRARSQRESQIHYDANLGKATFDISFEKETELTGYMKLHLWVEADGNDDMDLFVAIQKLDKNGKWLPTNVFGVPHPGTPGKLRVSLRKTDPATSTEFQPMYPYNNPQKLKPGEIVPIDIELWPSSRIWHPGVATVSPGLAHHGPYRAPFPRCTAATKSQQIGNVCSIEQNSSLPPFTISYEWNPRHSPLGENL